MKKLILSLLLMATVMTGAAKTSYVATYSGVICCEFNGQKDSTSSVKPEMSYSFHNDELVVTILHEELDAKTIKSIKRAKANAGWSEFFAGMNAGLAGTGNRHDAMRVYYNMEMAKGGLIEAENYRAKAADLQNLSIDVMIENNSDKEIYINDMVRGLTWFVKAKSVIVLPLMNPGQMQLRVAYAYPEAPDAKYFTIKASSTTKKEEISYEDFDCIVFPKDIKEAASGYMEPSEYVIMDKDTRIESPMTKEEFEAFRKENKAKEKEFKNGAKK